ncbi:MAG: ClbS/DfsB family four-helix bundle protein [Sulfitobacter sp.]
MPATTKSQLLDVTAREFDKLGSVIAPLDAASALIPDEEGICIKDIVAHRAHWIDPFLNWYADGQAGKEVFFPAQGYKWNELPRYNADLRVAQKTLGWKEAIATLHENHARLTAFLDHLSDEDLYGGPMKGAKNKWTPGRWAEAAGPSHYRSATKYIRKRL